MLYRGAFRIKERGSNLSAGDEYNFPDHLRKTVECYVDDIAVKSHDKNDYLRDLGMMFDIMRAHRLKMNPTKSFLGVSSGKFLGFNVTSKGIHLDPDKVKAIQSIHLRISKNLRACKVDWLILEDSSQTSQAIVNRSPDSLQRVSLLYGIKPVKKLMRISKIPH